MLKKTGIIVGGFCLLVVFIVIGASWGVAFTGIPYAIALKTGNPGAVNASSLSIALHQYASPPRIFLSRQTRLR